MDLDGVYDLDNIFAKIIRGEIPCAKVWEDAHTLAFLDAFPQGPGHTLVVHKRSTARNLLDVEPVDLAAVIATVQRVTRAVRGALTPDGVTVMQLNGAAAGQTIYHLHFHIIPRWLGQPLGRHAEGVSDPNERSELARRIAAHVAP
ncbi:MAG TPA: HIT family protein [Caulobacteraceae bacterium]|jgi:histidine triad (HIT) family protein|nr:HIT family protein [Caulobacteraceae bacterium]